MKSAGSRARRFVVRAAVAVAVVAALCWFPFAGRYLVAENTLEHADVIVVLAGARVERWLEAVDLYNEGWAPRIVMSPGRLEEAEAILHQRGIRFPSEAEVARDTMLQMKVPAAAMTIMPRDVDNTAQEATEVREMARANGWSRIIVVTSKYHTRRAGYAFRREFRGTPVAIIMHASRYDVVNAKRWWTDRAEFREVTYELQKLIAYRLGLGG